MALTFMAILAVAVEERVSTKTGTILLWPLLALAVFNLLHAVYRSRKPTRNRCWPRPISKSRSLIPTVDRWPRAGAAQGSSATMFKSRWKDGAARATSAERNMAPNGIDETLKLEAVYLSAPKRAAGSAPAPREIAQQRGPPLGSACRSSGRGWPPVLESSPSTESWAERHKCSNRAYSTVRGICQVFRQDSIRQVLRQPSCDGPDQQSFRRRSGP